METIVQKTREACKILFTEIQAFLTEERYTPSSLNPNLESIIKSVGTYLTKHDPINPCTQLEGNLCLIYAIAELTKTTLFKNKIVTQDLISLLAYSVKNMEQKHMDEFHYRN